MLLRPSVTLRPPHWVELVIPCNRTHSIVSNETGNRLPDDLRNTIGLAFRAVTQRSRVGGNWIQRKVRIAHVLSRMLLYRVADPGLGFTFKATHAAVGQPAEEPIAHVTIRDQLGIRQADSA